MMALKRARVVGGALAAPREPGVARRPCNLQQANSLFARLTLAALALAFALATPAFAEAPKEFSELQVKGTVYRNVRVVSRNPSSITVRHAGGIAQIQFKDMAPELQAAFGFVAEDVAAYEEQLRRQAQEQADREAKERTRRATTRIVEDAAARMDKISKSFSAAPELRGMDMRPRLRELELYVKDQGTSPSCAVYAVVSALELQAYEINRRPEKYSEGYLVWATKQVVGERAPFKLEAQGEGGEIGDAGFSLAEVFQALNRFGIPTEETMKEAFDGVAGPVDMPKEMIAEARKRSGVIPYAVPGRNNAEVAVNMVHVLNNGLPVVLALRWPHQNATQGGLLSTQPPIADYAHAVTVVGYVCETDRQADVRFIFKNSWGPKWGATGFGYVDMQYLSKNLLGAAFIDLIPVKRRDG